MGRARIRSIIAAGVRIPMTVSFIIWPWRVFGAAKQTVVVELACRNERSAVWRRLFAHFVLINTSHPVPQSRPDTSRP